MAAKFSGLISKAVIIITALIFSQFPAYENSYSQRLAGHVDELRYQIEMMQEIAKQTGKTLDEFINKFISHSDQDFQMQGQLMHREKERFIALENALFSLDNASALSRPFIFALHSDSVIAKAAFKKFRFSIPLTVEGLIWAVIGAFCGYFLFSLFRKLFNRILPKTKSAPPTSLS